MSEIRHDQPLVPSVLDRLIDDDPEVTHETDRNQTQVLRDLKVSVGRDLKSLLNTRIRCILYEPDLAELDLSLVNYGIRDLTGLTLGTESEREEFKESIETVIRQ